MEVDIKIGGDDIAELRKLVERLEKAIEDGRGVLKDLNQTRRGLVDFIELETKGQCVRAADQAIETMTKTIRREMDESVAKVAKEFDDLKKLYMGQTPERAGQPTIEDMTSFAKVVDHLKKEGKMPSWLI
jgi:hypothetical protein